MRGRIVVAALALVAAMVAAAAPVAHAASGAELTEASGAAFPAKTFVLTLPDRRDLRPNDVSVSENGQDVEGLRIVPGDAAGAKTFGTVLVIDTSQSMRGAPIAAAMAAARRFAEQRPAQQRLGVVFFNREATVALRPTTDAARIAAVLASPPQLAKGTRIYDSTALAMRVLRDAKVSAGSVVLLSDGADVGSNLKPGAVADAARHAKTRIFSVGLRSRSYDGSTLRDLATSAGGRHAEADEHQLAQLFSGLGRRFGREYLITYRSLAPLSTHVQVQARVAGVSGAALVTYTSPAFRAVTDAKGASRSAFMGSNASLALAAGLVALLIGLAAFLVLRSGRRTVHARIADFTADASSAHAAVAVDAYGDDPGISTRRRRGTPSRRWAAFAEDVDVAGLSRSPERIALLTVAGTALAVLAAIALGNPILAVLVLVAPVIVRAVVSAAASRARREFDSQLADNLQVVASAMRAGHSFVGALAVAVEDALEPAKRELHRAVGDERLGVPLDEALSRVAGRMRSEELEYVGLVATLQRETGGSTAEVLDRVTETIRGRAELKRVVRTLTAQGRLGGIIVTAVPVCLTAFFLVTRPGYFDPLIRSLFGVMCIVMGGVMLTTGWLAIRKIVDIKV
jgi:tight adherence protein B